MKNETTKLKKCKRLLPKIKSFISGGNIRQQELQQLPNLSLATNLRDVQDVSEYENNQENLDVVHVVSSVSVIEEQTSSELTILGSREPECPTNIIITTPQQVEVPFPLENPSQFELVTMNPRVAT
jgi:hypothetical protein